MTEQDINIQSGSIENVNIADGPIVQTTITGEGNVTGDGNQSGKRSIVKSIFEAIKKIVGMVR